MTKRPDKRLSQNIAYVFSAIVALSMILSLIGPLFFSNTAQNTPPTPTWPPPTWTPTPMATLTPAPAANELVFAVLGNGRETDQSYRQLLQRVVADDNAFLVHTGNMVSDSTPGGFEAFHAFMAGFVLPFYPAPGSEDRSADGSLSDFVAYSGAPAAHYSFDAGSAHLTVINSASGVLDAEELAWLDADLAMTTQPVKLVFTHYPPLALDDPQSALVQGGEAFLSIAQARGVDVVFAGRVSDYREVDQDGVRIVTSGGAGAPAGSGETSDTPPYYVQVTVAGTETSIRLALLE